MASSGEYGPGEGILDKTLAWKLFGWGGIPRRLRPVLEAEGIRLAEAGVPGRLVIRDLEARQALPLSLGGVLGLCGGHGQAGVALYLGLGALAQQLDLEQRVALLLLQR